MAMRKLSANVQLEGLRRQRQTGHPADRIRAAVAEVLESRTLLSTGAADPQLNYYLPTQYNLHNDGGYLSAPATGDALSIAMGFLRNHAAQLGLASGDLSNYAVTDRITSSDTGVTHLYLRQTYRGLEVANANLSIHVMADGRVLSAGGGFVPGLSALGLVAALPQPVLSAAAALGLAAPAAGLGLNPFISTMTGVVAGVERATTLLAPSVSLDRVPARLKYVAQPGGVVLVWDYIVRTPDGQHWYDLNVDSTSGRLALGSDWVDRASYNVYPRPVENPADGTRTIVVDPINPVASPYGWHDTNGAAGAEYTDTRGNNVSAQDDWDFNDTGGTRPNAGAGLIFDYPIDFAQDPHVYLNAAVTNLFYWNNLSHDLHYVYGFNEASGNFQVNNYGRGGAGNDAVQADAQDGEAMNNANFGTPPDGSAPRMQMFEFDVSAPHRDGDLDNIVIVHEYGHGVSNRVVGGPANVSALDALQSGGMGEGWGDWWGLMFTQKVSDTKMAPYSVGTYVVNQPSTGDGIRRYPYSFDMSINPLTFGSYNSSNEVHDAGEIWASALWDMNWLLIDKYGFSPNIATGYTGAGSAGNVLALKLVMDSLKLAPANPTFLNGRDALLQADQVLTGGANQTEIWTAFARRGMGASADDGGDANATVVDEAFDMPVADPIVVSHSPTSSFLSASSIQFTFNEPMNAASFTIADVASFTGPGSVDLRPAITSSVWDSPTRLRVNFAPQSQPGIYSMRVGPQILAADNGHAMDQDRDGTPGEAAQDQYTATLAIKSAEYTAYMDVNPNWTYQSAWAWGDPAGLGGDPGDGSTGTNVVGYNLNGAYADNITSTQWVTTGAINLSGVTGTELTFQRWLGVEESEFDHAYIAVSNNGSTWTTIWQNTSDIIDTAWQQVTYDISAVADNQPTVYVRWGLGATDESVVYSGWNIDDVIIAGIPSGPDISGPGVTSHTPTGTVGIGQAMLQFTFNEWMNTSSFTVASDVVSFTGPGGVDLKPQITGFLWVDARTLRVQFAAQSTNGTYTMVIGPNIMDDAIPANFMNQDGDAFNGEPGEDRYAATFTVSPNPYSADMSINPGWSFSSGTAPYTWQYGVPTGGGFNGFDPASGHTGSNVVGFNLSGNYPDNMPSIAYATTPAFSTVGYTNLKLGFWRWLAVEDATYDHANVEVWDGTSWLTLWNHEGDSFFETSWSYLEYSLPASANNQPAVMVRWGMGTTDSSVTFPGWNIDDVMVTGTFVAEASGPRVTSHTPAGTVGASPAMMQFTFDKPMHTGSFDVASDVASFTGPTGTNLKPQINGFTWVDQQTLRVNFISQAVAGPYTMVIGPNISDAAANLMNQDSDAINGESVEDRYAATFTMTAISSPYSTDMSSNPGWTFSPGAAPYIWQYGVPTGGGSYGLDPTTGHTGNNVVGFNLSGDYPNGMASVAYATTPAFRTVGYTDLKLGFWRWLGIEDATYDHANVEVWDGTSWLPVWNHTGGSFSETSWSYQEYLLPASVNGKPAVKIRWGMGTTDGSVFYPGWNIDDVLVLGAFAGDFDGPRVTSHTPTGTVGAGQATLQFTFDEPMYTGSFDVASDVVSFTGPGGINLKPQITNFIWVDQQTLRVSFAAQAAAGTYNMVIGPNISDTATPANPMNQDSDAVSGEAVEDRYTASFTVAPSQIEGDLWHDLDHDALRDAGEPTLAGWTVYLDADDDQILDAGEVTQVTNASGHYVFGNLSPGTYHVREVVMPGWVQSQVMANHLLGVSWTGVLYDVDQATGATSNPRNTGESTLVGITARNGVLYTLTTFGTGIHPNSLYTIDPATGSLTLVGATGLSNIFEGDLDADLTTGFLYGLVDAPASAGNMFIINPVTGAGTWVAEIESTDPSAMAFDSDGTLWVLDTGSDRLLRIDKATGAAISSVPLSTQLGDAAGMDFDPDSGLLYVADSFSGIPGVGTLFTLNPLTGQLTAVGLTGLPDDAGISGLTFLGYSTGAGRTVTVAAGQIVTGQDFGNYAANAAPTNINSSGTSVAENQPVGTAVGSFSTVDPDAADTFTYSLVSGTGAADNASFTIAGNQLRTAATFNFEAKSSYSIRVRTTDQGGLTFEKEFTINVSDVNEAPTELALNFVRISPTHPLHAPVGTLVTADQDLGAQPVYTLVAGAGDGDNGSFYITANKLRLAQAVRPQGSIYSVRLRSTDSGGLWVERSLVLGVDNVGTQYTVNSLADVVASDGVVTLREAIEAANNNTPLTTDVSPGSSVGTNRIFFDMAALRAQAGAGVLPRITLNGPEIWIGTHLDITGPGPDAMVIDADGRSRILGAINGKLVSISGLTLTGGLGEFGAGVAAFASPTLGPTTLALTNVKLVGNTSNGLTGTDAVGGGAQGADSDLVFRNVTISGNRASASGFAGGGGIYVYGGSLMLINSVVSGNVAASPTGLGMGGGIYSRRCVVAIVNSAFSGNVAVSDSSTWAGGGAIYASEGSLELTNATLSGNAVRGMFETSGAISVSGVSPRISNTIVALNYPGNGALSGSSNLVGTDPRFYRNPSAGADALWGTADDDWGDLRLQVSSPAINAGSNALIPYGINTDVTGGPRIVNGTVDIGAYEQDAAAPIPTTRINGGTSQRSMVRSATVTFDEPVVLGVSALRVLRASGAVIPGVTVTQSNPSGDQKTWELTFSGPALLNGSLPDGLYQVQATAASIADLAGNVLSGNYSSRFHRLFGDSDGDRDVDVADMALFKTALNRPTNYDNYWYFDFTGNGIISLSDFQQLRLRSSRPVLA